MFCKDKIHNPYLNQYHTAAVGRGVEPPLVAFVPHNQAQTRPRKDSTLGYQCPFFCSPATSVFRGGLNTSSLFFDSEATVVSTSSDESRSVHTEFHTEFRQQQHCASASMVALFCPVFSKRGVAGSRYVCMSMRRVERALLLCLDGKKGGET